MADIDKKTIDQVVKDAAALALHIKVLDDMRCGERAMQALGEFLKLFGPEAVEGFVREMARHHIEEYVRERVRARAASQL